MDGIKINIKRPVVGGFSAAVVILIGGLLIGQASGYEAYQLFITIAPTTRDFCRTLMLALATILALMLTVLGISASLDVKLKKTHYQRIKQISWLITVTLIVTVVVYLLLNIPVTESDKKSMQWFTPLYYTTLAISSLLGGAFIAIALLLYSTIRDMISLFEPGKSDRMLDKREEEE